MNKKYLEIISKKELIIVSCLDYLETSNPKHKDKALNLITDFASLYVIKLKKSSERGLKESLRRFILNEKGYIETLQGLYNSLI